MDAKPRISAARPADLLKARIAVSAVFFMLGAGSGIWAVHIPLIQARLAIDPAILGLALLALAIGAVLSMPLAGWLVGHAGSRRSTAAATLAYLAVLPLPMLAGTVPLFFAAAFAFGFLMGSLDVVANVQASEVETARQRPTMSSFHAFFSIGGLAGALIGALIIAKGWGDGSGATGAAIVLLGFGALAAGNLYPSERPAEGGPRFALPSQAVLVLGGMALLCYAIEGAVTDWSALFLTKVRHATPTTAAVGFALFSLAMAGFRLFGDPLVAWLGNRKVLIGGGLVIAGGLGIALAAPWPLIGGLGFGLVGVGAANVVPVLFSAGARTPGVPAGVGVAAIATMGYTGYLFAPPILGFVANQYGLSASLGLVLAMGLAMAWLGRR